MLNIAESAALLWQTLAKANSAQTLWHVQTRTNKNCYYVKSDKQSVILSGDKLSLPLMSAMCAQLLRSDSGSNGHQLDFGCEGLPLNGGNFQFDF